MTIRHTCISLDCPLEWQQALSGIRHDFGHTWENNYAMYLTTGLPTCLYCFEMDDIRIVCPFSEREFGGSLDIVKPFGFSGFVGTARCPEFPEHWKDFVRKKGYVCGYLGVNPLFDPIADFDDDELFTYDSVHVLNLEQDMETLYANLSRTRRRELKKWEQEDAEFCSDRSALTTFFLEHFEEFMRSKAADGFYFLSPQSLSFLANLENIVLVGVQQEGRVVALQVNACTPYVAQGLFLISLPEGRNHTTAMIWSSIKHLKALGIPLFNLGGGAGGVAEYKRLFGGVELPLHGLKQIYDPKRYAELCRIAGVEPSGASCYFPAYRRPL